MSLKIANMKGKNEFTQNEINEIVALIRKRCSAPQSEQTKIRNKMRRIGFYGGDDFGVNDMTEEKFYSLIKSGIITINNSGTAKVPPVSSKREIIPLTHNSFKLGLEAWCGEAPYVLILGTFPSEKSLAAQAYYQNKSYNSFYKIMESLFERQSGMSDKDFIINNHIALWDCMKEAEREGSLDANIKGYVANDVEKFLSLHPTITTIVLNGKKAKEAFEKHFSKEKLIQRYSIRYWPSTSNANSIPFEDKLKIWSEIKKIVEAKS